MVRISLFLVILALRRPLFAALYELDLAHFSNTFYQLVLDPPFSQ